MWISYPHMPTGAIASKDDLARLVNFANRNDIILINDNPYSLILNSLPTSLLQIEHAKDHCLELNSLSESHNLAGMRVGVCVGKKALVEQVLTAMSNVDSGMYKGIQAAAIAALNEPSDWLISLNEIYAKRRLIADQIMEALDCSIEEPQAGLFRWARIPDSVESAEVLSELVLDKTGVFITPGFVFGTNGQRYLRISLCNPVEVLEEALAKISSLKNTLAHHTSDIRPLTSYIP
jgi:aspartate/methionine/tyrosine aminotransferase